MTIITFALCILSSCNSSIYEIFV